MASAHIDFETFSELDIKEVGAFRYAEHPSTEILILAFALGNDRPTGVDLTRPWHEVVRALTPLFSWISRGGIVAAHNAQFERVIWEKTAMGKRFPVRPHPTQWDCTAARARMLAIPGALDGAALALGIENRKDPEGKKLMDLFSKPQRRRSKGVLVSETRIRSTDRPDDFKRYIDYCIQDVVVEQELDRVLPPLSSVEARAFQLDYDINNRGMPVNMERVQTAAVFVEEYTELLNKEAVRISKLRPTQRDKTLDFLAARGFNLPDLQAATVERLAKDPSLPPDLVELLDLRIELSRAGTKKLKAIESTVSPDGRIRGGFLFSAASTRRWSSTGVQMHNLQKPEGECDPVRVMEILDLLLPFLLLDEFERPLSVLSQSIRGFFEAEGDQVFSIADYASVEPRGLAWLADEEWMLQAYRKKEDLYRVAAGKVYNKDAKALTKDGPERFMGKQLVLGCGYGMGPPRFIETVAKFGKIITLDESKKAVYGYRDSVPNITKFWRTLNQACIQATENWETLRVGKLRFRPETLANGFEVLYVDMPSGTIAYPEPFVDEVTWQGQREPRFNFFTPLGTKYVPTDTFGGSIAENVVQALCRDILRDGLIAADDEGFAVVGHVHDEGIAETPNDPEELREFEHCLSGSSPWAEGFPIETEGFLSKVYKK